jgi:hypothetical protein
LGLSASCETSVTVVDQTPPTTSCPADATIECGASTQPADTGEATAGDNCDTSPVISYVDAAAVGSVCGAGSLIERTWTATDAAGNSDSCVQHIHIVDKTAPELSCPEDVTASFESGRRRMPAATAASASRLSLWWTRLLP